MRAVANALLWPVRRIGALLPDGWAGLARQLAVFIPFDIAYELSRAFAQGGEQTALEHARDVVHAERVLGIYEEHAVQDWALDAPDFVMEVAKFTYFQCQFTITFGFVIWVYIWRHEAYALLRNCLFATFMLAVPGYIFYPTAPPRLLAVGGLHRPARERDAQPAGHAREALRQPVRGDAEPAHRDGHPRRRHRRARHPAPRRARDLGALPGARRSSRSWPRPTTSSSTRSPASACWSVALVIVLSLHRRLGWSLAPLPGAGDRSSAGTDRSSRPHADAAPGMRPSDR